MADPGFWSDQEQAQKVIEDSKALKAWVEPYERLAARVKTAIELEEMLAAEPDDDMEREVEREAEQLDAEIGEFELRSLLRGEADHRDAQVEIAAGAGGTGGQRVQCRHRHCRRRRERHPHRRRRQRRPPRRRG